MTMFRAGERKPEERPDDQLWIDERQRGLQGAIDQRHDRRLQECRRVEPVHTIWAVDGPLADVRLEGISLAAEVGWGGSSQFKSVASFGTTQQQIFSDIGYHRGVLVAIKHIRKEHIQLSRNVLLEFNEVGV